MAKITWKTPIVEMQGDEMTRVLWDRIKETLLLPHLELNTDFYDLSLTERERTKDEVTVKAANAIKKYGVGVKCATITPNSRRMEEYKLSNMWRSPNGTIRSVLDGTVFRAPIAVGAIAPYVGGWKKPITVARHAYGDVYAASEIAVDAPAKAELKITYKDGREVVKEIFGFSSSGIVQGMYNTDKSIESFARSCFSYALDVGQDVWFAAKDTISKTYDARFKSVFDEVFQGYKERFEKRGIKYEYSLIDDSVARVIRSEGGFIWALKNYDGDVMSDMVATAFGSLAMMTSVLVSPDGCYEYEAAHGTVTRHYYKYLKGESTSTNSVATIFAWSGALKKRAQTENNAALKNFAESLEKAVISTIEGGFVTGDLIPLWRGASAPVKLDSFSFLSHISENLGKILNS